MAQSLMVDEEKKRKKSFHIFPFTVAFFQVTLFLFLPHFSKRLY